MAVCPLTLPLTLALTLTTHLSPSPSPGAVPANTRGENFDDFVAQRKHVLVATDLAARGLDTLDVKHVVQFDFPRSAAEYLHRAGRTARNGARGTPVSNPNP